MPGPIEYRVILGDMQGAPLRDLSGIVAELGATARFCRPNGVTCRVPAWHPDVATLHTDGAPLVASKRRTLKAWRRGDVGGSVTGWTQVFAGYIENLQDEGGEDGETWTTFGAFDPSYRLAARLARDGSGSISIITFTTTEKGSIINTLISRANTFGETGIRTDGFIPLYGDTASVRYEYRDIGAIAVELQDSSVAVSGNQFELNFDPVDQTNGKLCYFQSDMRHRDRSIGGTALPALVFAYDAPAEAMNLLTVSRLEDSSELATTLTALGATQEGAAPIVASATASTEETNYGKHEAVLTYPDVTDQTQLQNLVNAERDRRKQIVSVVELRPVPTVGTTQGQATMEFDPWVDIYPGDYCSVISDTSMRGGFNEKHRIYGWDLTYKDGNETIDRFITQPSS